jgi:hypothetical protein
MPWGDRTGPWGMGPRTGWGMGYCSGYDMPGYANPYNPGGGRWGGRGRGWGRGFGRGRGYGRMRWAYPAVPVSYGPGLAYEPYYGEPARPTAEQEKAYLEKLSKSLEEQLSEIKDRLKELASKKPKE